MVASVLQEVGDDTDSTAGSTVAAPAITCAAGSALHIIISHGNSSDVDMAATPLTNTGTPISFSAALDNIDDAADNQRVVHYYANNVPAQTTTITAHFSNATATYRAIKVKEIGGVTGYDATANAHAAQLQASPGTAANGVSTGNTPTLSAQPALISAVTTSTASATSNSVGTGFTNDQTTPSTWQFGSGVDMSASESRRVTATTALAATFTAAQDDSRTSVAAVFLEAVSSGAMTAAMSLGFSVAGILRGAGAMSGTRAMSVSLTGDLTKAGWGYVYLSTPYTSSGERITATADLEAGDRLAWDTVGGLVVVYADATFDCDDSVTAFNVELWDADDQTWGTTATQTVGDPVVAMTGVVPIAFSLSATLRGAAAATASVPIAFSLSGPVRGAAPATASVPIAFSFSGPMNGLGQMTATRPMAFTVVGALSANGGLATTASAAFGIVGNLGGSVPATAALSFGFSVAGVLQGLAEGVMSMSASAMFSLAGDLSANGRLVTTAPLAFTVAGNLSGNAPIATALSFAFSLAGNLQGSAPGDITTDADLAFTVAGTLAAAGTLSTAGAMAFALSGVLRGAGDLFGATVASSFAVTGDLEELPDMEDMVGDMSAAFGWLAELVNTGQSSPITVTAAQFRAKLRLVAMTGSAYLDRYYNFAKRDADIAIVRVTFADSTRLDLPRREYDRLRATEKADVTNAGVSVSIIDARDGEY